jgi:hypothetical protein
VLFERGRDIHSCLAQLYDRMNIDIFFLHSSGSIWYIGNERRVITHKSASISYYVDEERMNGRWQGVKLVQGGRCNCRSEV